nr:hypothetical protein [Tanacetum cinerariifolium]
MQEKHLDNIKKYQSLKRKPISVAQDRKNMIVYLKNMAGYKIAHFKGSHSTQDTLTDVPKEMSEEDVKNMLQIILVSEFKVETLQVKVEDNLAGVDHSPTGTDDSLAGIARDARRSTNGNDSHNSGTCVRRTERIAREGTYTDFLKCQPLPFKGTEGVASLSQWCERMEFVFYISNCTAENQVKFATCTLHSVALTW